MTSKLRQLRAAICTDLAALSGVFAQVEPVGGQYSLTDLERIGSNAPAAFVSLGGLHSEHLYGTPWATVAVAIVCSAQDEPGSDRADLVLDKTEAVLTMLHTSPFSWSALTGTYKAPEDIRAQNLYTPDLDDRAVSLWVVAFTQQIDLNTIDYDGMDDFLRAYVDYRHDDVAEADQTEQQINLPGP